MCCFHHVKTLSKNLSHEINGLFLWNFNDILRVKYVPFLFFCPFINNRTYKMQSANFVRYPMMGNSTHLFISDDTFYLRYFC